LLRRSAPPGGAISDRFGRKGTLQTGLLIFIVSAALAAFSVGSWQLIAARAVMGVGAALVMPGTLSILATVFPPGERPKAIAIWASVAGGSVALSITWSGAMLENFWWGSIFLGMSAVAALALVVGFFLLPTSRQTEQTKLDPLGAALSVIGVAGLLYGFIQAPTNGWTSDAVLAAFAVGVIGLGAHSMWERVFSHPMLHPRFWSDRRFTFGSIAIGAAYFALFGMYFVCTQYLQLVRGYSPLAAGLWALPAGLSQFAAANLSRAMVARYKFRLVLVTGLLSSTAGLLVLATSTAHSSPWGFEIGLGLVGVGIGLSMPPATGAIISSLPPHKAGVGSAVNDLDRELGGAFGVGVLGSITLSHFQSNLAPALRGRASGVAAHARLGLAQALGVAGGSNTPLGRAARDAYGSALDLAMIVGAGIVLGATIAVYAALGSPARPVTPRDSTPDDSVLRPPESPRERSMVERLLDDAESGGLRRDDRESFADKVISEVRQASEGPWRVGLGRCDGPDRGTSLRREGESADQCLGQRGEVGAWIGVGSGE
jgi:EmrB/QacA subfamily drug resistance transporter